MQYVCHKKDLQATPGDQWNIVDKETIDEIIFRTANTRNRLMLELMARGGMRVGEVLNLTPSRYPKEKPHHPEPEKWACRGDSLCSTKNNGKVRLTGYVRDRNISKNDKIFPISCVVAWSMVSKAGKMVDIELRPHDLRRHAATYASRSGTPIEIVSKVILRHADLSTTQRYLGKVNDTEAIRWIETLYG